MRVLGIAALRYGRPDLIVWHEKPWLRRLRAYVAGEPQPPETVTQHLKRHGLGGIPVKYVRHHEAHAAGGFWTSGFDSAAVLVVDAIGECDTFSLWTAQAPISNLKPGLKRIWSRQYPHSIGLLYSAFTQRLGFKPSEEEYIVMGMAAFGRPVHADTILKDFVRNGTPHRFKLRENVHRGIRDWRPDIEASPDLAASIQIITENLLVDLAKWARAKTGQRNLVLSGGVALNCVANTRIAKEAGFDQVWIMPNPGDAGNALGAALAPMRRHVEWCGPYLGEEITRKANPRNAVQRLLKGDPVGWATGRAEFGPRALGNRSLLLDPRLPDGKERMNRVKRREPFRPFAPVVRAERAAEFFEMPVNLPEIPYMQFVVPVRRRGSMPAIEHVDGTARVQTLTETQNPALYDLLRRWEEATGCPVLLNTSMNVKGEPLVNTWEDAVRFMQETGVALA